MGMFSRISDIVQANINAILDKAEDPQKVVRLIIQEMEETMVEVRSVAARHLADKKTLSRKVDKLQQSSADWHDKAQLAVEKGREDLARAALEEKHQIDNQVAQLSKDMEEIDEQIAKLQDDTGRLQEKIAEARTRQKALNSRHHTATVRLKARNTAHVEKIDDAIARFDHYERRIDDLEAQVDAYDLVKAQPTLADEFEKLQHDETIEKELAALRKKVA